jgi:integrase
MAVKVRQRPAGSGVWWIFIDHQGRRKAKKIGRDKRLAFKVARKVEAKLVLGELGLEKGEPPCPTFKEYATKWLEFIQVTRQGTTHERYESILRLHINPTVGNMRLDEITRGQLRDLLLRKSNDYSKSMVGLMRDVLSGVFNYALDEELIQNTPVRGITKRLQLSKRQTRIVPLSITEEDALVDTARALYHVHYPLFLFLMRTGTRLGEALGLKWSDIDWEGGFVWIKRAYRRAVFGPPKNGRPRRIKMSSQLRETLLDLLRTKKDASEVVFGKDSRPWEQNDVRRIFKKVLKEAGIRHIRLHDLRHTWVTRRLSLGHNLVEVSQEAGHSSIKITVDTYYHWLPDNSGEGIDQLDQTQQSTTHPQPDKPTGPHQSEYLQ